MDLFDRTILDIRNYIQQKKSTVLSALQDAGNWPEGAGRNVVLTEDTAVELGNPQKDSSSSLLWTEQGDRVSDGRITLIGPDIPSSSGFSLPFGKVVLAAVSGFNEDNTYERYQEMEAVRYALDMKGYMIRAVSQYQREWSRISTEAVQKGFSFKILGGALRNAYLKKDYIRAVEFIFVTSSMEDVRELKDITKNVGRTVSALDKMLNEIDADCDECEYNDVCDEVGEIKRVKKNRDEKRMKANG